MAEEAIPTPKVERLVFPGKLLGGFDEIKDKLSKIPLYGISLSNNELTLVMVESRNIRKMPYLFHIMIISQDKITVIYSIPHDVSENIRRSTILKNIAAIVSTISDKFSIEEGLLLQYVDSTLDKILGSMSQTYSTLFNKYDSLLGEYRSLKRLNIELSAANRNLTVQTAQFNQDNKILGDKIKKLEKYSDEALMTMVQDWIEVHDSTVDIDEFAKTYGITAPRVEEILDKMVSLGYLELRN